VPERKERKRKEKKEEKSEMRCRGFGCRMEGSKEQAGIS